MITDNEILLRLVIAAVIGGIIGFERRAVHKPAGLRTHMLVSLGSALFTILSFGVFANDPARIIAGIVTGIGFLGAGTIFRAKDHIKGLTTAASLWAVSAVGIGIGLGEYFLVAVSTVLILLVLQLNRVEFFREI
ncbi:MgtC/SapB family protein [Candidatus Woesearchaeota archaeon]|nr:MgtC/SapB family protein [Candidatus Woesearchaeota archaeon]